MLVAMKPRATMEVDDGLISDFLSPRIYWNSNFYLPGQRVPPLFLDIDRQVAKWHEGELRREDIVTQEDLEEHPEEYTIPVPTILKLEGTTGPCIVTKDWYFKEKEKKMYQLAEYTKDRQVEMMHLISRRDRVRYKLGQLSPFTNIKDAEKVIYYNQELRDIACELEWLESISGVCVDQLDYGSKLGKFIGYFKNKAKKVVKKVKKFYKEHREIILAAASVVLPILATKVVTSIFRGIAKLLL